MLQQEIDAAPLSGKPLRRDYRFRIALILLILGFIGCDRDPLVRIYDVPKAPVAVTKDTTQPKRFLIAIVPEGNTAYFIKASDDPDRLESLTDPLRQIAAGFKLDEDKKPIWSVPEEWKVLPGNEIATAILEAPTDSQPVRFVVTALTFSQDWESYLELNINRWRRQLGLPENSFAEQKADLVEVARDKAVLPAYLLDLLGESSAQPPRMGGGPPPIAPPSVEKTSPPRKAGVTYVAPEGWNDVGASGMREASFKIAKETSKGEVSVIFASGDRLSNVERWLGQLNPSSETSANKEAATKAIENATAIKSAKGVVGQLYSLLGPEGESQTAMLAAVLPMEQGEMSVFVKLTGSAQLAEENRDKLIQFISSLQW